MSGHRRTAGAAATIAAAIIAAGPLLSAGTAHAVGNQTVSFTGGSVAGLLVCKSEPSTARLNVAAESRVVFTNRLGQTATLRVDGQPVTTVGADQAVPVVFHYGPVSVAMTFSCGAGVVEKFSSTSVSVAPAARPAKPNGSASHPSAGAAGAISSRGSSRGSAAGRSATPRPGTEGTGGGVADPLGPTANGGLPAADPSGGAGGAAATGGAAGGGKGAVAVEPLVPASDSQRSASYLLALLAAVCAVGVTVAAVRAIISKRIIQTRLA